MKTEIFLTGGGENLRFEVPPGEHVLGRAEDADIRVEDLGISAHHARLVVGEDGVSIQDLGSANGTFVEGVPAEELTEIREGAAVMLGAVALRVRQREEPQLPGEETSRYVRGKVVAYGGMGEIYEAEQTVLGRKVAMKVMQNPEDADEVRAFLDEARITGKLEHPNIVPVYDLDAGEGRHFFYTMKYVHGETLADVIGGLAQSFPETVEKYPLSVLLTIFQKVCDAVAFAHSRGIWHCDLKPANIMIGDFGEVLVMDWGLAREAGVESAEAEEPIQGTPAYMAPEQARGEAAAMGQCTDIYALGAILYALLHLQPPVRGDSNQEIADKVAAGTRDAPEEFSTLHLPSRRVPASLEAVGRKAMAFYPEARYQRVQNLQADITACQAGFATSAEAAGLGKHLLLFVMRNRAVSLAIAVGLVLLVASTAWFTVSLLRERNRVAHALQIAEKNEQEAKAALEKSRESDAQAQAALAEARRSGRKAEAAIGEKEEMRERYLGGAAKAAAESARLSRQLLAEERFDEAMAQISNAVQLTPDNAGYQVFHAGLLQSTGRLAEAAEVYRHVLAAGDNGEAKVNLELTEKLLELQDGRPGLENDAVLLLEKALMEQQREIELPLLHAASSGRLMGAKTDGADAADEEGGARTRIEAKLSAFTRQRDWREERLSQQADGSWAIDLSGLRVGELPVLRGENVSQLDLHGTDTASLEGLRGLRLTSLNLGGVKIRDLTPIRPMLIEKLVLDATKVESLEPLRGMPLRDLRLTSSRPIEISELSGHPTLRHLDLSGADVREIAPVLDNEALESLVLSPTTTDTAKSAGSTHLKKISYAPEAGSMEATMTREEFFAPRVMEGFHHDKSALASWDFDNPEEGDGGWKLEGSSSEAAPSAWHADPVAAGGRGGGYLSVVNKAGPSGEPYVVAPREMSEALRNSYGGALEFDLRSSPVNRFLRAPDVILEGAGRRLYFTGAIRPDETWQSFLVPLREHPGWHRDNPGGPVASASEIREALAQASSLRLRTQFSEDGRGRRQVGIDDVTVWGETDAAARQARLDQQDVESAAWGRGLKVVSAEMLARSASLGLRAFREGDGVWLSDYQGQRGVLAVHPLQRDKPAVITFRPGMDVPEGAKLKISGRGSFEEPGVRVVVRWQGKELKTFALDNAWKEELVELPSALNAEAGYDVEVHANGWNSEFAFFNDIALRLPDGFMRRAATPPVAAMPFPGKMADLDGPWVWTAPRFRAGLVLAGGKLPGAKWTFRLVGQRLLVESDGRRFAELRRSSDGNWYGLQSPDSAEVSMVRVSPALLNPPRSLTQLNGTWILERGQGASSEMFQLKRGKPMGYFPTAWKLRIHDGILRFEGGHDQNADLIPLPDGSWLGYEPWSGRPLYFHPARP